MSTKVQEVVEVNEGLEKVKGFWEKNKNIVIGISTAAIIIVGGWWLYKNMIVLPKELKAAEASFKAEQYFKNDSLQLALNGDGQNKGFVYIAKEYSGTKIGNLANYYAGVIYLRTGDFNNAVKYLKDFSTDAKQIQMIAYARLADAYSELGKKEDAVELYKKAGHYFAIDDYNSPEFLFRAGYLLESMGKNDEALSLYKEIQEKYPKSEKGYTIEKYIFRLSAEKNDFSVK